MDIENEQYQAYLLRLWLFERDERWVWRVALENIHTGERHGFASLNALVAFLQEMEKTGQQLTRWDQPDG